jgi:nitroreductase
VRRLKMKSINKATSPEFLERNKIFDEIVKSRRSIRDFKQEKPPRESIEAVIRAGMLAPYAALAVRDRKDFRRFFVFENKTQSMRLAIDLMKNKAKERLEKLKKEAAQKPSLRDQVQPFLERLEVAAEKGIRGVGTAPYFIVVAEMKGIPASGQESLAHILENMWLKGTALGLGFHLVSQTSQMEDDEKFTALLGIPVGQFALNGCAVGYPKTIPAATLRPEIEKAVRWLP